MENSSFSAQQRRLSLDGLRSETERTAPRAPAMPGRRVYFKPKPAARRQHQLLQKLQLPLLFAAGTIGGLFADNVALGLGLLAAYAIWALVARIPSRTTFTLALLVLAAISLLLLFKPNIQLIRNFATYAFVLLLIAVVTLGREARLPKRAKRNYRR